jgi:integrase
MAEFGRTKKGVRRIVLKDGSVRFQARFEPKGQPGLTRLFETDHEAAGQVLEWKTLHRSNRLLSRQVRFADAVSHYRRHPICLRRTGRLSADEGRIRYWVEALGHRPLMEITPADVAEHREALARRGLSGSTVNKFLSQLSVIFTAARERWNCDNPARGVMRHREDNERLRVLSDDEFWRLYSATQHSQDYRLLPMMLCALGCGARQRELMMMRWEWVDLAAGTAYLPRHATKARRDRRLRFGGIALDALRSLPRAGAHVWEDNGGGVRWPREDWERALTEAGIDDLTWRDLRTTSATWLAMLGASGPVVAHHLGHLSLSQTARYVNFAAGRKSQVAAKVLPTYGEF